MTPHRHSWLYDAYMGSWLWRLRRVVWFWTSTRRCERCGRWLVLHESHAKTYPRGAAVLTVHHRSYRRLGHERRGDVMLLCWPCHQRVQLERDCWLAEHGVGAHA